MGNLKRFGILMLLFGAGSFALNLIGYEFSLLMWIDNWGTGVGNGIRGGLSVLGAVLWFIGWKAEQNAPAEHAGPQQPPAAKPEREAA